jgi:DNA sulfur modification protein DndE
MVGHASDDFSLTWYPSMAAKEGGPGLAKLRLLTTPPNIEDYKPYRDLLRPVMVILANCHNVLLDGPTFRNSPNWNIHPLYSDNVTIRNVTVFNEYYAQNGDGIDIDSCRDVSVYDDKIDAGDDVLCFKSGRDAEGRRIGRPTENVSVTRCVLGHGHGGVAFGSEMSGGIRNVEISQCVFNGTDDAIRFKTVRGRGNVVENINIHDVQMYDIKNACIQVDMYYMVRKATTQPASRPEGFGRRRAFRAATEPTTQPDSVAKPLIVTEESPMPVDEGTPQFRDITIRNLSCAGANIAMIVRGLPELPAENITIENANITAKQGGAIIDARSITLRNVHIWSASVPVFQIQNGTNITLEDFDAMPQTLR